MKSLVLEKSARMLSAATYEMSRFRSRVQSLALPLHFYVSEVAYGNITWETSASSSRPLFGRYRFEAFEMYLLD